MMIPPPPPPSYQIWIPKPGQFAGLIPPPPTCEVFPAGVSPTLWGPSFTAGSCGKGGGQLLPPGPASLPGSSAARLVPRESTELQQRPPAPRLNCSEDRVETARRPGRGCKCAGGGVEGGGCGLFALVAKARLLRRLVAAGTRPFAAAAVLWPRSRLLDSWTPRRRRRRRLTRYASCGAPGSRPC